VDPLTGLPHMPEPTDTRPGERIRMIGLVAGILLALGAGTYFFSGQQFTPAAVTLLALAALMALVQSILAIREIVSRR
jgi:drug/metabolite transporter (DMT)-like permease